MRKKGNEHLARDNKHTRGREMKGGGGLAKGEDALESILGKKENPFILILDREHTICASDQPLAHHEKTPKRLRNLAARN